MLITKEIGIDMAHRVPNHGSKCRNLHGHRYKIEVGVDDKLITKEGDPAEGMVIDFSDLKKVMMDYIDASYDHWAVFYKDDKYRKKLEEMIALGDQNPEKLHFVDFIPTAENLAKYWFQIIDMPLREDHGINLEYIKVWETPTSVAKCTRKDIEL